MLSLRSLLILALSVAPSFSAFTPTFPYGEEKIRGVNIGGWLVLEPWITPSLFDNTGDDRIIDEYTFGQYQDRDHAAQTLKQHWDTFITKDDFRDIAAAGLNHVRIPIGHWAWDVSGGEPYIQGQIPYLSQAIKWAEEYNLKVIVDLHGAPGSQNGFDNSGRKLPAPTWHTKKENVDRTNAVVQNITAAFKDSASVVSAVAPLNEPAGFFSPDLVTVAKQFWKDSFTNIRFPDGPYHPTDTAVIIHDTFQPLDSWAGFMPKDQFPGVLMDSHRYQMFTIPEVKRTDAEHLQAACAQGPALAAFEMPVVIGEWTPAPNDCAKYLNGRGLGARYDGTLPSGGSTEKFGTCEGKTGKTSTFDPAYKAFLKQYWEAQAVTYEKSAGWIQWTWKTEGADDWSYKAGLAGGWIPQNPTDRNATICG